MINLESYPILCDNRTSFAQVNRYDDIVSVTFYRQLALISEIEHRDNCSFHIKTCSDDPVAVMEDRYLFTNLLWLSEVLIHIDAAVFRIGEMLTDDINPGVGFLQRPVNSPLI